jgi:D-threo-aldose 1-dehydrogenase
MNNIENNASEKESRRAFLAKAAIATAAVVTTSSSGLIAKPFTFDELQNLSKMSDKQVQEFKLEKNFGLGGVAAGNAWHVNSNQQIEMAMSAAWDVGVRYFDTSPFYGFGLSERRMGHFLFEKNRDEFVLSTKIGRVFDADPAFKSDPKSLWKGRLNFKYRFDYTAAGVRRSIEDSLQRLGLSSIDIVYVHDLSPDTAELGSKWMDQFNIAAKGAFPELTKMREEGIIKGWGMGVNTPEPILKAMEVADPDVCLVAIQYSLVDHKSALDKLFPAMEKKKVKAVIGGPLNAGFLANRDRFNYGDTIPAEMLEKRKKINAIIGKYNVDLRTVALQFAAAHPVVAAVIPGASTAEQASSNALAMATKVPAELWTELKQAKLIEQQAPVPGISQA